MPALVTIDAIKKFANIFPDTDDIVTEVEAAAESIVFEYLGFDPAQKPYSHNAIGLGDSRLYLNGFPVSGAITIDGVSFPAYDVDRNEISVDGMVFPYLTKHSVSYTAGFDTVPAIILHTVLQIAALLLTEQGNVGISGKSDPNTGSRTFISYTNFDKYLKNLKQYRLTRPLI